MEDCAIGHLCLPICLRVANRVESVLNAKFGTELLKLWIVELVAIVGDDDARQSELVDSGLSDEAFYLGFGDFGKWLSFDPLGEVVDGDDEKFSLASC